MRHAAEQKPGQVAETAPSAGQERLARTAGNAVLAPDAAALTDFLSAAAPALSVA